MVFRIFVIGLFIFSFLPIAAEAGEMKKYKIQVVNIKGEKAWVQNGEKRSILKKNVILQENQIIETGKGTYISILIDNESSIHIGPYSKSKIMPMKKKVGLWHWSFSLMAGSLRAVVKRVMKTDNTIRAEIHTEVGIIGVRGTDFGVTHSTGEKKTDVYVFKGNVAVTKAGGSFFDTDAIVLLEGFHTTIRAGKKLTVPDKFNIYDKSKLFMKLATKSTQSSKKIVPSKSKKKINKNKEDKEKQVDRISTPSSTAGD